MKYFTGHNYTKSRAPRSHRRALADDKTVAIPTATAKNQPADKGVI